MHTDLQSLLAVQADDLEIHGLEERLAALAPRLKVLDDKRARITGDIARFSAMVASEEAKQAFLRDKITEHKALIERNQAQMDIVKTMRQATAAVNQMDEAKRIVANEDAELVGINRRLEEARAALLAQRSALEACEAEQVDARAQVAGERAALDAELSAAHAARAGKAVHVPGSLLGKYDKIRSRRNAQAAWSLNGMACGACDTTIPMQRRNLMLNGGGIDVCEACGVLMYHPD